MRMRMATDDAMQGHNGLKLLDRATDHPESTFSDVDQFWKQHHPGVKVRYCKATPSNTHL